LSSILTTQCTARIHRILQLDSGYQGSEHRLGLHWTYTGTGGRRYLYRQIGPEANHLYRFHNYHCRHHHSGCGPEHCHVCCWPSHSRIRGVRCCSRCGRLSYRDILSDLEAMGSSHIAEFLLVSYQAPVSLLELTTYSVGALIAAGVTLGTGQWNSTWAWRAPSFFQAIWAILCIFVLPFMYVPYIPARKS